jgi:hypothetical protein
MLSRTPLDPGIAARHDVRAPMVRTHAWKDDSP